MATHLPSPSAAHGTLARGCSHLPASAADLLEQDRAREPCGTLPSAPRVPPQLGESLYLLQHPWVSEGSR